MSTYKEFFNKENPLNLYLSTDIVGQLRGKIPINKDGSISRDIVTLRKPWETWDDYFLRRHKEREEYEDYIKRLKEYNSKLKFEELLAFLRRGIFNKENLDSNPKQHLKYLNEAKQEAEFKANNPTEEYSPDKASLNIQEYLKDKKRFSDLNLDITGLIQMAINREDKEDDKLESMLLSYKNLIKYTQISKGLSEEEFKKAWSQATTEQKMTAAMHAVGRKWLEGEVLDDFINSEDKERIDILSATLKEDPNYESEALKYRKLFDSGDNIFAKYWKKNTDILTASFLKGISGGYIQEALKSKNPILELPMGILNTLYSTGAEAAGVAVGSLGELIGGAVGTLAEYGIYKITGGDRVEDVDERISSNAASYIDKKSLNVYEAILDLPLENLQLLLLEFDKISEVSSEFRAEKGTQLTDLGAEERLTKLKLLADFITRTELYGEEAAIKGVSNFWKDTIASKQTFSDRALRTAGTFFNSGVADIAAFIGVLTTPIFEIYDPVSGSLDPEGYSDALVTRNPILTWANNLQETGAWDTELQKKYKDLGVNALLIYKTSAEENSFLTGKDVYDIIGQYGFTAATSVISVGGSAAVKGLAMGLSKALLKRGVRGKIARSMLKKATRDALKKGLASNATEAELTAAKETATRLLSSALYKGNLGMLGLLGTAEGALEAKSTYNTFKEENEEFIERMFSPKLLLIDNDEEVRRYMISKGLTPLLIINTGKGMSRVDFTPELYEQARQELLESLDVEKQQALEKLEDDATDAAFVNLLSNSLINGFINVIAKESIMSRDMREASRILRGKNKFTDLIDIVKKGDSWEAVVRDAIRNTNKKSLWKKAKDITGKTFKNAAGEFGEEYGQSISDLASRDALQYDLNQYLATVFDKDAREAFLSDWTGMLDAGLNSIMTNALNLENLKEGIFGAASAMLGGFSPVGAGSTVRGFIKGRTELDKGFENTIKWVGKLLGNLYLGGVKDAFRDYREEAQTASRLAESVNTWLNNDKSQLLLTHLGGAMGFKKALEESLLAGDIFEAHNNNFGIAVENAFMLQALANTDYGKAIQEKIRQAAELLNVAKNENGEFDEKGNYVGNTVIGEGGQSVIQEDWVSIAINTYKNQRGDETRNTNETDLLIVERLGRNAQEFLLLQDDVISARKLIKSLFRENNLDPLVELSYVYALLTQNKTRLRRNSLNEELNNSVDASNLTEEDKKKLERSGLNDFMMKFLIEHGSIENAEKKLKSLRTQSNQASEDSHDKEASKEDRASAKRRLKYLNKEIRKLEKQLGLVALQQLKITSEDSTITLTEDQNSPLFSVGDMASMSILEKGEVIANKKRYSEELLKIIDDFLTISRKTLSLQKNDVALTNEEVARDYIDLATLDRKANSYDNYLTDYLNNPRFLTTVAATLRHKERTRVLRHLYKEDLQTRDGETALEFEERINKKVQTLEELGKNDDAKILKSLIQENDLVRETSKNLNEVTQYAFIRKLFANSESDDTDTPEFTQMLLALSTLIAESGMSMAKIKKVLDTSDLDSIMNVLLKQTIDGQYVLNKALIKAGLPELALSQDTLNNETILAPIILNIKKFVDFAVNTKNKTNSSKEADNPKIVVTPEQKPKTEKAKTANIPQTQEGNKEIREDATLTITTPGDLDANSELRRFLDERGVSENVKLLNNTDNPNVYFAVLKEYGKPVVFAVQVIPSSKATSGRTINIEGFDYLIIGVVNEGSDTMLNLGKQAFSELQSNEEGRLLKQEGLTVRGLLSRITDSKAISEESAEKNIPLNQQLNSPLEILEYINKLILGSRKKEETSFDEDTLITETTTTFIDHNGYPLILNPEQEATNDFGKYPVEDTTLEDILRLVDLNDLASIDNAINQLKKSDFFKALFIAWKGFNPLNNTSLKSAEFIYKNLLGNFVFLGYPLVDVKDEKQELKTQQKYLNPRIDSEGYLVIDSYDKEGKYGKKKSFRFKLTDSSIKSEELALRALMEILAHKDYFVRCKTLLNFTIGENKNLPLSYREQELLRLQDLIKQGLLVSRIPSAVKRDMRIPNPFIAATPTKSHKNNPGASLFNPAPKGTVENGKVNIEDGSVEKGKPLTYIDKIKLNLNEALKKAENIVIKIKSLSKGITLPSSNASFYQDSSGKRLFSRATSNKHAVSGKQAEKFAADERTSQISHALGNTADNVIRASLEALNKNPELDRDQLLLEILKDDAFKGGDKIPNYSNYQIKKFLSLLILLHLFLVVLKGWVIEPKSIKAFGLLPVLDDAGNPVGKLPTAGTLDLLAYDQEGKFHIIDIKSFHENDYKNSLQANKESWEAQIMTYQAALLQLFPDMEFGENFVLPVVLDYSMPLSDILILEDGMTIEGSTATSPPALYLFPTNLETADLEEYLFSLDTPEFEGYEYSKLEEEDKARVVPITTPTTSIIPETKTRENEEQEERGKSKEGPIKKGSPQSTLSLGDLLDDFDPFSLHSERTSRLARFTEFINNHIAPVDKVKIGVIARMFSVGKSLIGVKGKKDIYEKELSNIFFNGDTKKLRLVLKGLKISEKNLPQIMQTLRAYYDSYIENQENYSSNITKRYELSKAVYSFLKGDLSLTLLEEELNRFLVSVGDISELVEYMAATNKEEVRSRLINKFETSKAISAEKHMEQLKSLKATMESMQAKSDFLNYSSAEKMLKDRVNSVQKAIIEESYEEVSYKQNSTIEDILRDKSGSYGSMKLLRGVILRTKNGHFKKVATALLRQIKEKLLTIPVVVEDGGLNFLEGSSNGKVVTILKNSLDSYEHFERVLLHELLHSVVDASPEIKNNLKNLMEEAITHILQSTGKTIEQIKLEHYGFSNVDEFISEFFTNYAFLETLKTIDSNDYTNIFDRIIKKIKEFFTGDRSVYNQISETMETILSTTNIESTEKKKYKENKLFQKTSFDKLSAGVLSRIISRGISAKEFNNMVSRVLKQLTDCCR